MLKQQDIISGWKLSREVTFVIEDSPIELPFSDVHLIWQHTALMEMGDLEAALVSGKAFNLIDEKLPRSIMA